MEAGIVIPTCTVWRPTLEWFKKVNELQGKERKKSSDDRIILHSSHFHEGHFWPSDDWP